VIKGFRQLFLGEDHVCPWWFAYTFDNPFRRLIHPPERLFEGLVDEGQTAVDIGCGMGHFTLGLARMVGQSGQVIAVDLQERMLGLVRQRAARSGLLDRIELRQAAAERLHVGEKVDFVLAFWMAHEVPDKPGFFEAAASILKPSAHFLLVEPKGHVTQAVFEQEVMQAQAAGLIPVKNPSIAISRAALFVAPSEN
jgi:ubiquinone/menaquinone biosynthesis C-methylase UbiE